LSQSLFTSESRKTRNLLKVAKTGGLQISIVDKQFNIAGLQVDENYVYWSDQRGALFRIMKAATR